MKPKSPEAIQLHLKFQERLLGLKTSQTIPLPFEETSKENLRLKIQHNYNEIKIQFNACQIRLDQVLAEVSKKNAALFALLDKAPKSISGFSSSQRKEFENPEKPSNYFIKEVIPQRDVYRMKIPIQTNSRKILSTSERYKAQYMV